MLEEESYLAPVSLLFANFGVNWVVNINWIGTALYFPVEYSSTVNGICCLVGRVGSLLAFQFAELHQPLPLVIFFASSLVGITASLTIKKDKSKPL